MVGQNIQSATTSVATDVPAPVPEWYESSGPTPAMKSDLRNLITAQEAYYSDWNTYAQAISNLGTNYNTSNGVTVSLGSVTGTGWLGTATSISTAKTCHITLGGGSTNEGDPICQ